MFVNALLGQEIIPVDQQPCTTLFCEVHDMHKNSGVEEAHAVCDGTTYDQNNDSTFSCVPLEERLVAKREDGREPEGTPIKLYVADTRVHGESLLNNGAVDISLIDAQPSQP